MVFITLLDGEMRDEPRPGRQMSNKEEIRYVQRQDEQRPERRAQRKYGQRLRVAQRHAKQEKTAAEEPPPTEDYAVNTVDACVLAEPNGFSSDQSHVDERRRPGSKMERWANEDSDEGHPRAIQLGTMLPMDDEGLVTSQENDITTELLDTLFDSGRPSLVTLVVTELG
ncbi:hypothetical protein Droror1_Dr00018132 [Drosera rotundifolia]